MSAAPRVSGCIVTYRCYEKCREAVASLYAHTKSVDFTLYIVDNCSGDDTLEKLRAEFPQLVTIANDANKGFGHGHNAVLPYLDSEYHAVINPDILLDRDAIGTLCDYLGRNPDVGIVTPQIRYPDGRDQLLPKRDPTFLALFGRHLFQKQLRPIVEHYQMLDEDLTKPIDIEFATGCFFVIRTDVFKRLGGFDERYFMYFEDMDITRSARGAGYRAVYDPDTYVFHAWERSSNKKAKFFVILVLSMFKYFGKWGFRLK
ncbi:MAG: glycosyltransferase family 2 protein [Oscillospiraceae bacterium]|nr:glycosyltransferase family 2 protein [Oscillospiraceae bacterium]